MEPDVELMQCPYDPVHRIIPKRMQNHLVKCKKSILLQPTSPYYQRAKDMVVCKFNSLHHVPKHELDRHHNMCPSKKEFFANVTQVSSSSEPEKKPGWMNLVDDSALRRKPDPDEENWDDEWQETYDPMEKINSNPNIMHNPQGLTQSQRRDYAHNRKMQSEGATANDDDWDDN